MKRILLFTLLISLIGYSQNPIKPNHPNFKDGLPQDLVEKMNSINLELGDNEMDFNPIQRVNGMRPQTFQREMMVHNDNTYRLDGYTEVYFVSFTLTTKEEVQYDLYGNRTLKINYTWDTTTQSFIPSSKNEDTYDQNGNRILHKRYIWDTESQSYILSWKSENTYDQNGNSVLILNYFLDTTTQSFIPSSKNENTYDENGNIILSLNYTWDTTTQSFISSSKYKYIFDENGEKINKTTYKWYPDLGIYKPSLKMDISTISETETNLVREGITYEYDTNFNTWNELEGEDFKSYWYYTKTQSLSTNSVEPNSFSIYPNPTSNSLHINSSESLSNPIFELYDVKGSKILSNPFKLTKPIDVSDLQPSMYIYNVKDGSEVKQSGKVLIE